MSLTKSHKSIAFVSAFAIPAIMDLSILLLALVISLIGDMVYSYILSLV